MRCRACDYVLSDFEATRKFFKTSTYIELCNYCFEDTGIIAEPRIDLAHGNDLDEETIAEEFFHQKLTDLEEESDNV